MEWYKKHYRRNLVDMHIDDWNSIFLSKLDPFDYVENLKLGQIEASMLYLQSHTGLCYWPTKSGKMHNALCGCEDKMKRIEKLCHENGMSVIAYYSLIYNNWAYEHYPEWRMMDIDGNVSRSNGSRYGLVCPNNPSYREFVEKQIIEFCEYFDFEGIFFDMLFWPMICYCPSCRERWNNEVGSEMPRVINWKSPEWKLFQKKRTEWMGDFAGWITQTLQKYKPNTTVENQYSSIMSDWKLGVDEKIALSSTYSGGDRYGGIEDQSFACKLYYGATQNMPFEYMTSRCYPSLAEHTTTKSIDMLRQSVMMTYAHHGAALLIDAIDPVGTMDRRVYERIGQVFSEVKKYEKFLNIGKLGYDVALYYDLNGKYNVEATPSDVANDRSADHTKPMNDSLLGAARSLRNHHIPYGVVNNYWFEGFQTAKVLVLSDVPDFENDKVEKVLEYLRNGGSLYMSGHCSAALLEEIFGLKYVGITEEPVTYISPTGDDVFMDGQFTHEYPLVMFEKQLIAEGDVKGDILGTLTLPYTVSKKVKDSVMPFFDISTDKKADKEDAVRIQKFASIHSNPPGKFTQTPALVSTRYGKGKAIWCAAPIERPNREQHNEIFARIISFLGGYEFKLTAEAPECIECVLFEDEESNTKLLSVINMQETFHILPVHDFSVSVRSVQAPKSIDLLPEEKPIDYIWENGNATIHFDKLQCAEMVRINY